MGHANRFWAEYVRAVCPSAVTAFWAEVNHDIPIDGETAAYKSLQGIEYSHANAHLAARKACAFN